MRGRTLYVYLIKYTLNAKANFMYTNKKMIIAGNILSLYEYENVIKYGHKKVKDDERKEQKVEKPKENTIDSRRRSMYRSRQKLINLVYANCEMYKMSHDKVYLPYMWTLTFREDIRDIKEGNAEFTKFIKRLNYHFTQEKESFVKYVAVIEFQDLRRMGVIHYHCLFFNIPFLKHKKFEEIWGNGYVQYESVNDSLSAAKYISKYMTKTFGDERLCGEKCYFASRGLKQPFIIRKPEDILVIRELLSEPIHQNSYDSEYQGQVDYSQFNLRCGDYSRDDIMKVLALRGYADVEL